MKITVNSKDCICELIVKSENGTFLEDVAMSAGHNKFEVEQNQIEQLFAAGFDLSRYNKKTDVETLKILFEAFLNDSERAEFLESIKEA